MTDLKPCPFCGQQHDFTRSTDMHFGLSNAIICQSRVLLKAYTEKEKVRVLEQWNTRPIEDALRAELEEENAKLQADLIGMRMEIDLLTEENKSYERELVRRQGAI